MIKRTRDITWESAAGIRGMAVAGLDIAQFEDGRCTREFVLNTPFELYDLLTLWLLDYRLVWVALATPNQTVDYLVHVANRGHKGGPVPPQVRLYFINEFWSAAEIGAKADRLWQGDR